MTFRGMRGSPILQNPLVRSGVGGVWSVNANLRRDVLTSTPGARGFRFRARDFRVGNRDSQAKFAIESFKIAISGFVIAIEGF